MLFLKKNITYPNWHRIIASLTNTARKMVCFHLANFFRVFLAPNPSILVMDGPLDRVGNRNSNSLNLPTRHRKQVGSLTVCASGAASVVFVFFSVCSGDIRPRRGWEKERGRCVRADARAAEA